MIINQKELIKLGENPKSKKADDVMLEFLKSNKNRVYSLNQICINTGLKSGGNLSSTLKTLVNIGKVKTVNCPCGNCFLYYVGSKEKIRI